MANSFASCCMVQQENSMYGGQKSGGAVPWSNSSVAHLVLPEQGPAGGEGLDDLLVVSEISSREQPPTRGVRGEQHPFGIGIVARQVDHLSPTGRAEMEL